MERVHLDILGPFNTSEDGNRYALMMIDQFTKWVEMAVDHRVKSHCKKRNIFVPASTFLFNIAAYHLLQHCVESFNNWILTAGS
jgi:hypothetical protein